jgi:hypothetical protein
MNSRNVSALFGAVFLLAGILGFVPNPLVAPHGVFAVNLAHNLVHVATGCGFLLVAWRMPDKARTFTQVFGAVYGLVALLGFLTSGDMLLGFIHINQADRWLHVGLAAAILAAGLALPQRKLQTG